MLKHLTKLAARAAQLRAVAQVKEAGLLGAVGSKMLKNPLATAGVAMTGLSAGQAVTQKTKEFKSGFDPNSQQQLLGRPPTPPGA